MLRTLIVASTLTLAALATGSAQAADKYKLDKSHARLAYTVNHMGFSDVSGDFTRFDGELMLDAKDLAKSSVSMTIETASITSGFDKRDDHLKTPDFFDAAANPSITFKSTKVEDAGNGKLKVTGDLNMHGVTKAVTLDVKVNKIGPNPMNAQQNKAGFTAVATIKRSDFGIKYALPAVADEVSLKLDSEWAQAQ